IEAGKTRMRPVLMTAAAMILGMIPMALGIGEGAEQNAPLGRAVIGGLIGATVTTLFFVPVLYSFLRRRAPKPRAATPAPPASAGVAPVVAAPPTQSMTVTAEVRPWKQVSIYSKIDGYLGNIGVDKGDAVRGGDLLAVIQAPEVARQLDSARADYVMKSQRVRRSQALAGSGLVSDQD